MFRSSAARARVFKCSVAQSSSFFFNVHLCKTAFRIWLYTTLVHYIVSFGDVSYIAFSQHVGKSAMHALLIDIKRVYTSAYIYARLRGMQRARRGGYIVIFIMMTAGTARIHLKHRRR